MPVTTFSIGASADDQRVYKGFTATYPPTGSVGRETAITSVGTTRQYQAGSGGYAVYVGLLKFDTSTLGASAVVLGATLRLYVQAVYDFGDDRSMSADWYAWDGVSDTDYTDVAGTNAHAGTDLGLIGTGSQDFTLTDSAGWPNVSRTGNTYLRLHTTGAAPTTINGLDIASFDDTNPEPQLLVTWTNATRLAPDAILAQTNLTGAVSVIQDDPDSPDANWLTAP